MITAEQKYLRTELEQRASAFHGGAFARRDASLSQLLTAVDAALGRIDQGTFGLCRRAMTPLNRNGCWPIRSCGSASTTLRVLTACLGE